MITAMIWTLMISAALGFWRVIAGPSVPDRIVAADALSIILTTTLALLGLVFDNLSSSISPLPSLCLPSRTCLSWPNSSNIESCTYEYALP